MSAVAEMAVVKGDANGEIVVDAISSIPLMLFPTDVSVDTIVAKVVTAIVLRVDRVVGFVVDKTFVANVVVVVAIVVGLVGITVVDIVVVVVVNVDKMVLIVAAVILFGASVGINGNLGHGSSIGGPSILSNT